MKKCPYCLGEIEDEARKCKHCGEWIEQPAAATASSAAAASTGSLRRFFGSNRLDETLNEGAKLYVKYSIVVGAIGLIVFLVFLFAVWLPGANEIRNNIDNFPTVP